MKELKEKLIKAYNDINELKDKLNKSENNNEEIKNNYEIIINEKDKLIEKQDKLIEEYKKILPKPIAVNPNDMVAVNFISKDQKIHFALVCNQNDTFAKIEEKLYEKYPEYRKTNNSFIAHGNQVLRFQTIKENKIGNGLPVFFASSDDS